MTLTHEAMLQDATAKAALEIPLVVIGSVDKYKHTESYEMRIETKDGCLAKRDFRLKDSEWDFLAGICRRFNDNKHNSVTLTLYAL